MLHIKLSNIEKLDMKLNHGSLLAWPIPKETNINCTKASAKKKIQKQKHIMKSSSNHIVITQKDKRFLLLKTTKKILG